MSYKLGFDGAITAELEKLLQSIEKGVNGFGIHAQTSDTGGAAVTSGTTTPPCPPGQACPDSVKGGHDWVLAAVAIVGGAVAGYVGGKIACRHRESVKGGHD